MLLVELLLGTPQRDSGRSKSLESSMRKSAVSSNEQTAQPRRRGDPGRPLIDLGLVVLVAIWVCALLGIGLLIWSLIGR